MTFASQAPLLDARTWLRRAVAAAVDQSAPGTPTDPRAAGATALRLAEAGMAPASWEQASASEAKQVAYLVATTALARHSLAARRPAGAADAQAVATMLWLASRWLWSSLEPHERIGACRVPPASAAPVVEVLPDPDPDPGHGRRRWRDRVVARRRPTEP